MVVDGLDYLAQWYAEGNALYPEVEAVREDTIKRVCNTAFLDFNGEWHVLGEHQIRALFEDEFQHQYQSYLKHRGLSTIPADVTVELLD